MSLGLGWLSDMAIDLYGPNLKLSRAEHHISELETIFRRYVNAHLRAGRAQKDGHRGKGPVVFGAQMPKHVPTVLGDAIHNLRVSLDHA